jgi:YVTN family beta-propeller protein
MLGTLFFLATEADAGTTAFATNRSENTLSIIDISGGTLLQTVPTGRGPQGLSLSPDGWRLCVTNASQGTLTVINTRDLTLSAVVDLGSSFGPSGIRVAPGGDFLYVTGISSTKILVFDTRDLSIKSRLILAWYPRASPSHPTGPTPTLSMRRRAFFQKSEPPITG